MKSGRRWAPKIAALVVYIIVILVAAPMAQQQPASFTGSPGAISAGPAAVPTDATAVDLLVGRSTILNVGATISRVSLTVPDVADAMVTSPQQLLIHGKTPGTISLFVWDRAGGIKTYEVNVRRDLKQLADQYQMLFPGEPIAVASNGKDVVISGTVSSKYIVDRAADLAAGYVEKKDNVVNLLKQVEGQASNQVMLRVRFAEVSRNALQELGASLIANGLKNDWFGRTTTQQFAAPDFDSDKQGGLTFSDFLNVFLFNTKHNVGAVVKALQSKGLFQSLAEPNLIATNGKEASFLAGGEYPYPVAQAGSGNTSITIQFKEFGVRLSFTPTVLSGDLINLKVKPEVSSLDFANGVSISGFRVPALSTRRTETEVELQDGQTFAIAGLMNNTVSSTMSKIPGIGDIPVLGYLFQSRAYQKQQTELVVMITPQIVRRGSTGVSEGLPTIAEPYLAAPAKRLPQPAPYTGSPRYPAVQGGGTTSGAAANQPQTSASPAMPAAPVVQPVTPATVAPTPADAQPMATPAAAATPMAAPTPMALPATPAQTPEAAATPASPEPTQKPLTKDEQKRMAQAHEAEKRQAAADAKRKAEDDKKAAAEKVAADRKAAEQKKIAAAQAERDQAAAAKKAADEKAQHDRLEAERVKREAEVAKKNAEADRKRQDEQKKQDKALSDAAARLHQAQAAYEAEAARGKAAANKGQQ